MQLARLGYKHMYDKTIKSCPNCKREMQVQNIGTRRVPHWCIYCEQCGLRFVFEKRMSYRKCRDWFKETVNAQKAF